MNADPELRPASFAEIADTIERANPACLRWGQDVVAATASIL